MQHPGSERFVRSRLKTRHLVLLDELGERHSILHAAIAANMTQPAASKMLSELEKLLGTTLFERLPRGVTPTPFGEIMIRRARAALAEMNLAHQEVMNLMSGLNGRVAVGTVLTPATDLLPAAVLRLKSQYPKLHVAIEVDTSKSLLARLRSGQLEMMVGRVLDPEALGELDFEPLSDEPHCIFARAGHPLQGRADLTLADLAGAGWILPAEGSILRDRLTALFLSAGLDLPEQTIETTSLPMITQLLAQSDMLVALPRAVVRSNLDNHLLAALPVELELRLDPYGIVTRRNHPLSPGGQVMLRALREAAGAGAAAVAATLAASCHGTRNHAPVPKPGAGEDGAPRTNLHDVRTPRGRELLDAPVAADCKRLVACASVAADRESRSPERRSEPRGQAMGK
jgi:DNA-binding transcriptional LysR family regulator